MSRNFRSGVKTPEPTGADTHEVADKLDSTRLGRVIGPILKALKGLKDGQEPDQIDIPWESIAARVDMLDQDVDNLSAELEHVDAGLRQVNDSHSAIDQQVTDEISKSVKQQLLEITAPDSSSQRVLVHAPTKFSDTPTLVGRRDRLEELKINFTCLNAKSKFSGTRAGIERGENSVLLLLESLVRGQEVMTLSRDEFLNVFISCTTGEPQSVLIDLIKTL